MLAYPCLLLGRRLGATLISRWTRPFPSAAPAGRMITVLAGGLGLAGWDLFLDPQMVAQGNWSWTDPSPGLPGVPGVPLTNYAGWLLVSMLIVAALDRALPAGRPNSELNPAVVLAWTWLGSTVGNLAFFDRPWVALYGGLAMGAVTLPYLLALEGETAGTRENARATEAAETSVDRTIEDQA
jgi:putative membrane protein